MQQYFINEKINKNTDVIKIDDEELYRHLIKVLRMRVGDKCIFVDLNKQTFVATLLDSNESLNFKISFDSEIINTEFDFAPIIACSLSKKDKMEWIAQKSTEMGAKKIIFFTSQFSIMKWDNKIATKKIARLQEIVKNAAQQSHRKLVPEVKYYNSLKELIAECDDIDHKLVAYEEVAKKGEPSQLAQVFNTVKKEQSILCLFGPEGGFDPKEIDQLINNSYLKVGLGPRILRAETAPVYFLGALSYKFDLI